MEQKQNHIFCLQIIKLLQTFFIFQKKKKTRAFINKIIMFV